MNDHFLRTAFGHLVSETLLALLHNSVTETLGLREGDERLVVLGADHEDVHDAGGEGTALGVLDVDNLERTDVLLTTDDGTNTALVLTLGDGTGSTDLELDGLDTLASGKVHLDNIVELGDRVWVPDSAGVVGVDLRDTLGTDAEGLDAAELEARLLGVGLVVETGEGSMVVSTEKKTVGVFRANVIVSHDV